MSKHRYGFSGKIMMVLSLIYLVLLINNLLSAKPMPALIALGLFLLTSPYFFRRFKAQHYPSIKALNTLLAIPLVILLALSFNALATNGTDVAIPPQEQDYIDTVLSQITTETTKAEAIALLGKPDRDLVGKVNWWVVIDGSDSRVGIYFSPTTGYATEIVLDGGTGRFYYRQALE